MVTLVKGVFLKGQTLKADKPASPGGNPQASVLLVPGNISRYVRVIILRIYKIGTVICFIIYCYIRSNIDILMLLK